MFFLYQCTNSWKSVCESKVNLNHPEALKHHRGCKAWERPQKSIHKHIWRPGYVLIGTVSSFFNCGATFILQIRNLLRCSRKEEKKHLNTWDLQRPADEICGFSSFHHLDDAAMRCAFTNNFWQIKKNPLQQEFSTEKLIKTCEQKWVILTLIACPKLIKRMTLISKVGPFEFFLFEIKGKFLLILPPSCCSSKMVRT